MDHSDPFQKLKSVRMETETLSLEACTGTILCYLPRQTMESGRLRVSGADRRGTKLGCGRIGPLCSNLILGRVCILIMWILETR